MSTSHTPGPWSVDAGYIAGVADPESATLADARIMGAAPELLEALQAAARLAIIARKYFPKSVKNSDRFTLENTNACINKAIAKAVGK